MQHIACTNSNTLINWKVKMSLSMRILLFGGLGSVRYLLSAHTRTIILQYRRFKGPMQVKRSAQTLQNYEGKIIGTVSFILEILQ